MKKIKKPLNFKSQRDFFLNFYFFFFISYFKTNPCLKKNEKRKNKKEKYKTKKSVHYRVRICFVLVGRDGFGPSKAKPTDLQSVAFDRSATYPFRHSNMVVIMSLAGHYLGGYHCDWS